MIDLEKVDEISPQVHKKLISLTGSTWRAFAANNTMKPSVDRGEFEQDEWCPVCSNKWSFCKDEQYRTTHRRRHLLIARGIEEVISRHHSGCTGTASAAEGCESSHSPDQWEQAV
jgi:hypothetical protein